eukprot:GHVS01097180.1.p1 GENE.GHVS01097180.1~~GHVS01097180.1.p1  ORF type:complete len:1283 (-),score=205.75 GHVS01097180.1:616-4464(-)
MSAQSSVQSLSSALRSSLHAQEYLPVNTPLAPTGAPLFTKQVKLQSSCSLPSGERSIPTSSSVLSEDSVDVKMPEYDRSSPDTSSLSSSATMRSCSPSSTSDLPCPPNLQTVPPVTAASVTATTIIWLSEDDMRCSLVRLSPQQDCCFGEAVGIGRGIFMLYTQQEGLVVVQDISAYVPPWCPSKGGPCLRPFCLFAPPRLDAKNGRKFLPATVYTTQMSDLGAHSRENSTTASTTVLSASPSPSTPAASPDDKPTLCLPYRPTSPSSLPASSPSSCNLSPSNSCQYSLLPSADVSKLTVCALYTEELALLQLQRRHIQADTNGGGVTTTTSNGSSVKEVKAKVARDTTTLVKREDKSSSPPPHGGVLPLDQLGSKFFYPPLPSFPASFCSWKHMLLDVNTDTAAGKNDLLQLKPAGTTKLVDENAGLRSRLSKFKRVYKETFTDLVVKNETSHSLVVSRPPPPPRKRGGSVKRASNGGPVPAQTMNSKDGGATGRVCTRYQVDAEGRRVLRSGYELSGDYMKHQQQGKLFELQGVFGANAKRSQQSTVTGERKEAEKKKTRSTSSTSDSSSLSSNALRDVGNEWSASSLTDSAAGSSGEGGSSIGLPASGEVVSSANRGEEEKQTEAKKKAVELKERAQNHAAFIPGDLFGNTGKKWAYVADDFDEDGIDEMFNLPSVVAEECKLLAGKRATPLTGRCNVSLANLRSVSALQRKFSMSMYHYEGNRPIFLSCIQPLTHSDNENCIDALTVAVKGGKAGDEGDGDTIEELTEEKVKVEASSARSGAKEKVLHKKSDENNGDNVEEIQVGSAPGVLSRDGGGADIPSSPTDACSFTEEEETFSKNNEVKQVSSRADSESWPSMGREIEMIVDEQERDKSVVPKAITAGVDKELSGKENKKGQAVGNDQSGNGLDEEEEAGIMYKVPYGEMSYFGHVIEDGDILRVTYPSEYTGTYEEDIFRLWGEDTLRSALKKIVEMSSHGANTDFSAIHLAQYCQTLFWNLARLYEGDVDLAVRMLLPSLPERSRRQKRCLRHATEEEPKEKRPKLVDRKPYVERVQDHFEKLTQDCEQAAKMKEMLRLSLNVDRSKDERIRHKNLDDEATLIRSVMDETGQIFTRTLSGLTPLQKRLAYHHCLSINFTAPVELTVIEGKGRAVVAAGTIERDDFVLEYKGETLSDKDARSQDLKYNRSFYHRNGSFMFYFKYDSRNFAIDSTNEFKPYGVARLINHSRLNPNLIPKPTSIDGRARLFFIAKRTITAGTELLVDYGERDRQVIENNPWLMH